MTVKDFLKELDRRNVWKAMVAYVATAAVLPLVDMSAERDQQYLADGVEEELLNAVKPSILASRRCGASVRPHVEKTPPWINGACHSLSATEMELV